MRVIVIVESSCRNLEYRPLGIRFRLGELQRGLRAGTALGVRAPHDGCAFALPRSPSLPSGVFRCS